MLKKKLVHIVSIFTISLFLFGCGGSSSGSHHPAGSTPSGTFDAAEKSYLYNLFLTEYFWNEHVPQDVDYSTYTDPQTMIDALKYPELDRWSISLTQQQYNDFSTQSDAGFGFAYTNDFTIYMVRIASPADRSGLMRGDKIVSINGEPVTQALITQAGSSIGEVSHFTVNRSGSTLQIDIAAQKYSYEVTSSSILRSPQGKKVGYLRFDAFTDNATDELEHDFTYFKGQNIDTLVVDLRYNGGGYLNTASIFLDKIGKGFNGQRQFSTEWNEQSASQNEYINFDSNDPNSLSLKKIVFLTTNGSASASELVINAMKPYMHGNVVVVGTRTHGKPVGMAGRTDGSYIYFLVNFVVKNAAGFYDYFDGLPPDCQVEDNDYTHQLGDPNEALLREALYHIDSGHC